MHAQLIKGNTVFDLFVPASWSEFFLFGGLGLGLLVVAARMAGVSIGSFPPNPFRWHWWLIVASLRPPVVDESTEEPMVYRAYVLFWAASLGCFIASALVLISIWTEA